MLDLPSLLGLFHSLWPTVHKLLRLFLDLKRVTATHSLDHHQGLHIPLWLLQFQALCVLWLLFSLLIFKQNLLFAHYSMRKTQLTRMVATNEMTELELRFHYFLAEITWTDSSYKWFMHQTILVSQHQSWSFNVQQSLLIFTFLDSTQEDKIFQTTWQQAFINFKLLFNSSVNSILFCTDICNIWTWPYLWRIYKVHLKYDLVLPSDTGTQTSAYLSLCLQPPYHPYQSTPLLLSKRSISTISPPFNTISIPPLLLNHNFKQLMFLQSMLHIQSTTNFN